jgi:tetratricopeptide (TPR) repeat protein
VGSALVLLTLVTIAFFVVGRFRAPVIPLLALLSGGAVARLLDLVPSRGSRNTGRSWLRLALAGSLLAGLLALVWPAFPPPSLPRATFDRAFLLASQARTLQAEGRVDEGLSCVNRALGLFVTVAAGPGDPERPHLVESALSQQAGLLVDVFGDIDRGQDLYGEVLRRLGTEGEDTTLLWFRLGTHASLGNIARARYDANLVGKDALDRARSEYESARALGDRLESLGHDNVEVRETRAWVEDLLAHLALVEGDEPRARSAYVRALRIVPEDAAALYGRARLDILAARRGELGSPGETRDLLLRAERDLTRASSADPPPDRIEVMHSLLAEVRARLGEE